MYHKLVNGILRDLNETTTGDAISYLPSQVGMISPALKSLLKMKKDWHITFLPTNIDETTVNFEDQLKVNVKKEHLDDFIKNVLKITTPVTSDLVVSLGTYLNEAFEDDLTESYDKLREILLNMVSTQPFVTADINFEDWKSKFGRKSFSSPKEILIKMETFRMDVDRLMEKLKGAIGDDKGEIDIISNTAESRGTLNTYPVFKDYKYLFGSIVQSEFQGVDLIYTVEVDMGYRIQESVQIVNDDDLLNEVGAYQGIKVEGNVMYPVGGVFTQRFFRFLQDNIIDQA